MRLMTSCVWCILCFRNSSSLTYFRQPPNLPTAARRNRKCTECGTTAFGRNRMSAESAHLSTFGAETETEAEIRSASTCFHHAPNKKRQNMSMSSHNLPQSLKSTLLRNRVVSSGESTKHLSMGGESLTDNDGKHTVGVRSQAAEQLHTIGLFHRSLQPHNNAVITV